MLVAFLSLFVNVSSLCSLFFADGLLSSKLLLNPCLSSPCGPHAKCSVTDDGYDCECLPNYINAPPNCRAECSTNYHCMSNMTCVNQHCINPCMNTFCGVNANCHVENHTPICECPKNHTGDPFVECTLEVIPPKVDPCDPNPCGQNAMCQEEEGGVSCVCLPDHYGNPDEGCMPNCKSNSDCPSDRMCHRNECYNPCPSICPENSDCSVENHLPTCACKDGYTGDAYENCTKIEDMGNKSFRKSF